MNNQLAIHDQVSQILKDNEFKQWSDKLDLLIKKLNNDPLDVRIKASQDIQGLCHIRSLGDLNIKTITGTEWNKKLEKLKKYARKKAAN
jgi:hypothetical protein